MNFPRIPRKTVLGRLLRFPFRLLPARTVMPILQGRLRGKKWIVGASDHGCWLGSYEYEKRLIFEKTIKEESVVFDVGAHVGFYTLLSSVLVGPRGTVVSFEPVRENLLNLKEHLRLNRITNVRVVEAAVSNRCGVASFRKGPSTTVGRIALDGGLQIKTVALDDIISRGEVPSPDCVKIDVEGAELLVLLGLKVALAKCHPTLFLATHGNDVHHQCIQLLKSFCYRLQPLDKEKLESSREILAFHGRG